MVIQPLSTRLINPNYCSKRPAAVVVEVRSCAPVVVVVQGGGAVTTEAASTVVDRLLIDCALVDSLAAPAPSVLLLSILQQRWCTV